MRVHFFDDPSQLYQPKEKVRINQIGLHTFPGGRRVAVGFDLTPFSEKPSLEVVIVNEEQEIAGTLNVIEAMSPNFTLVVHLRDKKSTTNYNVYVELYYVEPGETRQVIDRHASQFSIS